MATLFAIKRAYYFDYRLMWAVYQFMVPAGSRVLHFGYKNGYLLKVLKPAQGIGVDPDRHELQYAHARHPQYVFKQSALMLEGVMYALAQ